VTIGKPEGTGWPERLAGPDRVRWGERVYWQKRIHGYSTRVFGPSRRTTSLSWIGDQRIAIGSVPTAATLPRLRADGVTHVVNCRSAFQTWLSQDLAVERATFGAANVAHAPMWDFGQSQPPRLWSRAAHFAATVLADDPEAGVLIHCQQGRRRSTLLAYAVLQLRGLSRERALGDITTHRLEARPVDAYVASVDRWLACGAPLPGGLPVR
jgi:protein-tyrosine phosphatase